MTREITDKMIRREALSEALECPNCNGVLGLAFDQNITTPAEQTTVIDLVMRGAMRLFTIEDRVTMTIEHRDSGQLNVAAFLRDYDEKFGTDND